MAGKSHLDELIDYTDTVIDLISKSQMVLALISDNPDIVLGSDEALTIIDNNLKDYDYIDGTQTVANAMIMVDTDMVKRSSSTMKDLDIYVQIVVSKSYMSLVGHGFKGLKGNRKNNIARFVDLALNGSREFGIGKLELISAVTDKVPDSYTSKLLSYTIPNFAQNRKLLND